MKLIVILLITTVLLLIPLTTYADTGIEVTSRVGNGTWVGDIWDVSIYPGETTSTIITLYNSSSKTLGVEVSVIPLSFDGGNLAFELGKSVYPMGGNTYSTVTLTAKASGNTTPGKYTTELSIKLETEGSAPLIPYWPSPTLTSSPILSPVSTPVPSPLPTPSTPIPTTVVISPSHTPTTAVTTPPIPTLTPITTPISVLSQKRIPLWLIVAGGLFIFSFLGLLVVSRLKKKSAQ